MMHVLYNNDIIIYFILFTCKEILVINEQIIIPQCHSWYPLKYHFVVNCISYTLIIFYLTLLLSLLLLMKLDIWHYTDASKIKKGVGRYSNKYLKNKNIRKFL